MPWKVAIFNIQNAMKTAFIKGITWNLVHKFFTDSSSTNIPFFENLKFWGDFFLPNLKKNVETISAFQKSEISVW